MQVVIREVAKRLNVNEDLVDQVIRSAEADCREFIAEKRGYCIWFPNLGTFYFRVLSIKNYVQRQRMQLAYWKYRLVVGQIKNNSRTILAAEDNITRHTAKIKQSLLIKKEYIEKHADYNKDLDRFKKDTAETDISRLDELLNVDDLIIQLAKKYKGQEGHLSKMSDEGSLQDSDTEDSEM